MDALFGESSGDEDYDPNAPDPLATAGDDAAGSPAGDEEAEYVSDGDAEREALAEVCDTEQKAQKAPLIHAQQPAAAANSRGWAQLDTAA